MFLSTKDFVTWELSLSEEYFGEGYEIPVRGLFVPSPDVLFEGEPVGEIFAIKMMSVYNNFKLNFVIDEKMNAHIAVGRSAVCKDRPLEPIEAVAWPAKVCMMCQYLFWREKFYTERGREPKRMDESDEG